MEFKVLQDFYFNDHWYRVDEEFDAEGCEPDVLPDLQSRGLIENPESPLPKTKPKK